MLWRRSLYATTALAAAAVALYPNLSMLPSTSEAYDEQAAAALPFNDTEIGGGGSIRPVEIPGGKDTDKSVITKRDEQYGEEWRDGITEECPLCPMLFGKLKHTRLGTTVQDVQLQVRACKENEAQRRTVDDVCSRKTLYFFDTAPLKTCTT